MNVPLLDLNAQHQSIKGDVEAALACVLAHQKFIMGPEVAEFETAMARYSSARFAVGCASGSDALLLSLMAAGVGQGDAVITTPYTFFATAGAIARLGAVPLFVDIDPRTYNIDPARVREVMENKHPLENAGRKGLPELSCIKAMIPVHLYGQMADMDTLMEISRQHQLTVIEDAAQAIGSEARGFRAGTLGHCGCFSFFPSKNLGCMGDGGMITTNDPETAERLRMLRVHGSKPKYYHKVVGCNSRLDTLQAAILLRKLKHLDSWTEARQRNAMWYDRELSREGLSGQQVVTPYVVPSGRHIYNQYVLRVKDRNRLMDYLKVRGIGTEIYYPVPLHLQDCFASLGYHEGDMPVSEAAAKETVALPIYPELADEQRQYVVDSIRDFYERC